jgi:hypothetical protein
MEKRHPFSIWFVIGILLDIYGVIILGAGIYNYFNPPPPANRVVLYHLHVDIWWGVLLLAIGLVYTLSHLHQKKKSVQA